MEASKPDNNPPEMMRIFVSYAREDRKWLDPDYRHNLIPFLIESLRRHRVTFWIDKELKGGDLYEQEIKDKIDSSQIAVLIVSQSFLNSEFIENKEMSRIADRAHQGKMLVIPVLVEPCDWDEYPMLANRQMVPGRTPLIDFTESDAKWAKIKFDILDGIKVQLKRMREKSTPPPEQVPQPASLAQATSEPPTLRARAEGGDASAQLELGKQYQSGNGVPQDDKEAVRWFKLAAEQGQPNAQNWLGWMYSRGQGVRQDHEKSARYYRLAAEQGLAGAQNNLGTSYAYGRGVAQDDKEAFRWFRLAAEQGDLEAQEWLGSMYEHGNGVGKDIGQAIRLYSLAAKQGSKFASDQLARMVRRSSHTRQDA